MERIEETVEGLDPAPALFTRKMSLETGQPQLQRRLSPQPPHRGQLRPGGQRKMSFPATKAPSLSSYQHRGGVYCATWLDIKTLVTCGDGE